MPLCIGLCHRQQQEIEADTSIAVSAADSPPVEKNRGAATLPPAEATAGLSAASPVAAVPSTGDVVTLPRERIVPSSAHLFAPGPRTELRLSVQWRLAWKADQPLGSRADASDDSMLAVSPRLVEHAVNAPPDRSVSDNDFPGYSAECAMQLGALANGTYVSQAMVRRMVVELEGAGGRGVAASGDAADKGAQQSSSRFSWSGWGSKSHLGAQQTSSTSASPTSAVEGASTDVNSTTLDLVRHAEAVGRRLGVIIDVLQTNTMFQSAAAADEDAAENGSPTGGDGGAFPSASEGMAPSHTSTSAAMMVPGAAARRALQWTRRHLEAAHVVIGGFYASVQTLNRAASTADRVLPIIGFTEKDDPAARAAAKKAAEKSKKKKPESPLLHHATADDDDGGGAAVAGSGIHALHVASLVAPGAKTIPRANIGVSRQEVLNTDDRVSSADLIDFGFPKDDCVCAAFTGIPDARRESYRVTLQLNSIYEPDTRALAAPSGKKRDDPLMPQPTVTVSATVFGVQAGRRYALLRYDDSAHLPHADFLHSMWSRRVNFVTPTDLAPRQPVTLPSVDNVPANGLAIYRCVEIKDAGLAAAGQPSGAAPSSRVPGARA
jgi:hypothetical protein